MSRNIQETNFWLLFGTEEYLHDAPMEGDLDIREEEKLVAVFSSREKAYEYVERSKAPTFRAGVSWRDPNRDGQFVPKSLLHGSSRYKVRPFEPPELLVDPELP